LLVQKKRSKEKDSFFKEFFGKKAKNRAEIPAEQRLKKIVTPESREFQYIFYKKVLKRK